MVGRRPRAARTNQPLTSRSSLVTHTYPSFYACYLLKSIQTPTSKATYIGSTPNPPRRIRSLASSPDITQGAWKTKHRRPWVMQLIIHGFPSKLAALQFEWAWQHPHLSRHLKDASGQPLVKTGHKNKGMKNNIQTLLMMVINRPYSLWPLHVKIFTAEAQKLWETLVKAPAYRALPRGFTTSVELEGVDGQSGARGTGRKGPVDVADTQFTSQYLAKNTAVVASPTKPSCAICGEQITEYTSEPLTTTLCPASGCMSAAHLMCLSQDWLSAEKDNSGLIPRGGRCRGCQSYILYGDIIRGSYRRAAGRAIAVEDDNEDEIAAVGEDGDGACSSGDAGPSQRAVRTPVRGKRARKVATVGDDSSEGEAFDFDVSGTSDEECVPDPVAQAKSRGTGRAKTATSSKRPRGRPRKVVAHAAGESSEGEDFDFDVSGSSDEGKRPAPAPSRSRAVSKPSARAIGKLPATPQKRPRGRPRLGPSARTRPLHTRVQVPPSLSSGEDFDFEGISDCSSDEDLRPAKPVARSTQKQQESPTGKVAQAIDALSMNSPMGRTTTLKYIEISD
ncbi:hypothetical protein HDZ31DRAFT_33966 [Schizophyllum fasciatum]